MFIDNSKQKRNPIISFSIGYRYLLLIKSVVTVLTGSDISDLSLAKMLIFTKSSDHCWSSYIIPALVYFTHVFSFRLRSCSRSNVIKCCAPVLHSMECRYMHCRAHGENIRSIIHGIIYVSSHPTFFSPPANTASSKRAHQ